jgi:uncharacterized membrane protein YraQ (UPF0718 family)
MHLFYHREEQARAEAQMHMAEPTVQRPLWQTALFFGSMVGILVFANWSRPTRDAGLWYAVFTAKWPITAGFAIALGLILRQWYGLALPRLALVALPTAILALVFPRAPLAAFTVGSLGLAAVLSVDDGEGSRWFAGTWQFAKQILPLLLGGVLVAGFLLGRPGNQGVVPDAWIQNAVGGNSPWANFFASFAGALMYFATLTEVPILQGLIGSGMSKGPALALLLAGPALSLPSMLVLRSIMGTDKMLVFVALVVVMATLSGLVFGAC